MGRLPVGYRLVPDPRGRGFEEEHGRHRESGAALSTLRAQAALSAYTTLGLGGPAGRLIDADSAEQIVSVVREADESAEPVLVLGGGSNLVVADEGFPGTVVRVTSQGIAVDAVRGDGSAVTVTVAAGESWDRLVEWSVHEGLAGLECLSGIPGLVGATPIQNVGAYGQDVSETITEVRVYDRQRGEVATLAGAECEFGYRTSMLKRAAAGTATGRFVVLGVSFRLRRSARSLSARSLSARAGSEPALSGPVRYQELAGRLDVALGERVPLAQARSAVLALRRGKGMVLDPADPDTRSAGSFFTNPVLTAAQFAELGRRAAGRCGPETQETRVPHFDAGAGTVKVPAAWLIERAGFGKGYPAGGAARISSKHTLALTSRDGSKTADLLALAREIAAGVRAAFGVDLTNEPVLVGVRL
jgi:UDP-N-acetylmuramate dehydrogenase